MGCPAACLSGVCSEVFFHISASISQRNLYALCSGGRSKAPLQNVYSSRVLLLNAVFFCWRSVLMTAFIVNEQPVSGGCYSANCPLFRGPSFANSTKTGLAWKKLPTVRYCLPPEWLPFTAVPSDCPSEDTVQRKAIFFLTIRKVSSAPSALLEYYINGMCLHWSFGRWNIASITSKVTQNCCRFKS